MGGVRRVEGGHGNGGPGRRVGLREPQPVFQHEGIHAHGVQAPGDIHALIGHHQLGETATRRHDHGRADRLGLVGGIVQQHGMDDVFDRGIGRGSGRTLVPGPILRAGGGSGIERDFPGGRSRSGVGAKSQGGGREQTEKGQAG